MDLSGFLRVPEMSWNLTKTGNVLEKNIVCETIHLEQNSLRINIMLVKENFVLSFSWYPMLVEF